MGAGGKAGAGVYQAIINEIPAHERYVELCAGHGGVLRRLRPAAGGAVAVDLDRVCCEYLRGLGRADVRVEQWDVVRWLARRVLGLGTFVYCDPPYLASCRGDGGRGGPIYGCEMMAAWQHEALCAGLRGARSRVAVSHPDCEEYRRYYGDWRQVGYSEPTRGGARETILWCNYPVPRELHDYRYVGSTYREREGLARLQARWIGRANAMPARHRQALMAALEEGVRRDGPGEEPGEEAPREWRVEEAFGTE